MRGNNVLQICTTELLVAVQEYLDKRMRNYAPLAYDIQARDGTFYISLKEQPTQESEADPCPQCIRGAVCRTPSCGRLKLPLDHVYRNSPDARR